MYYVRMPTNTGKGFITHADWTTLSFTCYKNICVVSGTFENVNVWVARTGSTILSVAEGALILKDEKIKGLTSEIAECETKITTLKKNMLEIV